MKNSWIIIVALVGVIVAMATAWIAGVYEAVSTKEIMGIAATVVGLIGYVPYLFGMYRGKVKPHIFSWFIWGLIMETVFIIQWENNAGPGAWVTALSAVFCIIICIYGWRDGDRNITRSDWIVLMVCQLAIPLWYIISQPMFTIILLTTIEIVAFYPTLRKSWQNPYDEFILSYSITGSKFVISLFAIESFTPVNWLYPSVLFIANLILVSVLFVRRNAIRRRISSANM